MNEERWRRVWEVFQTAREMPAAEADEGTLLRAAHGLVETAEMQA